MDANESALDHELKLLALERAKVELDKLKDERARLTRGKRWYETAGQNTGLLTALVAALGFGFGIFQYAHQQSANRIAEAARSQAAKDTAEREFMKPWLDSQREIYLSALAAAATISNTDDLAARKAASDTFWQLYQGKMILVETKSVSEAMVAIGHCFDATETCDRREMNSRARALGTAMAESMAATARQTFAEFEANQFKYGPRQ